MAERTYRDSYTDREKATQYDQVIYGEKSPDSVLWEVEKRVLFKLVARHCPDHENAVALDFACGTGRILQFIRPLVRHVVGVDVSQSMLDIAAKNVENCELVCADLLHSPEQVPGEMDMITSFRFLLLAEPQLRTDCVKVLVTKLRDDHSIIVFGLHGNPRSVRLLGALKHGLTGRRLPRFGLRDMRELAEACGLHIVDVGGVGYIPNSLMKLLPFKLCVGVETLLCDLPFLRRFGKNLIVVRKKDEAQEERYGN